MNITVTLSAEEMQITRLAISIAKHLAEDEKKTQDITGRYMTDRVIDKYTDLETKLYSATLNEIRKIKKGVA